MAIVILDGVIVAKKSLAWTTDRKRQAVDAGRPGLPVRRSR